MNSSNFNKEIKTIYVFKTHTYKLGTFKKKKSNLSLYINIEVIFL